MMILSVNPSWIGDTMMSQSFYRTFKKQYPKSIIDVIAPLRCYQLLMRIPEINDVILAPFDHGVIKLKERRLLGYKLREKYYERTYVLPNSFKSALVPFFANIPHRIGWLGEMRYGLLNDIRFLNKKSWPLIVERYIALAYSRNSVNNSKDLAKPILKPKLQVFNDEKLQLCKLFNFSLERSTIDFCPGSAFGLAKCWLYYHYLELAKKLIDIGYQIAVFGSIDDSKIGEKIFFNLNIEQQRWYYNFVEKTRLDQVIILITLCKAVVTNDSGLMHITAALNLPIIALYGPSSDSDFTPPLCNNACIIHLTSKSYNKLYKLISKQNYYQNLINISPQLVLDKLIDLFY